MSRVALVVSDVDGTLLTKDKTLTDGARSAVKRLHDAGLAFTIISSRPIIGMRFLIAPLGLTLPIGAFNGSSIVDPQLKPVEQHLIPLPAAQRSLEVLNEFGIDSWLFTNEKWLTRNGNGEYVAHEKLAIRSDPTVVADFAPYEFSLVVQQVECQRGTHGLLHLGRAVGAPQQDGFEPAAIERQPKDRVGAFFLEQVHGLKSFAS